MKKNKNYYTRQFNIENEPGYVSAYGDTAWVFPPVEPVITLTTEELAQELAKRKKSSEVKISEEWIAGFKSGVIAERNKYGVIVERVSTDEMILRIEAYNETRDV